MFEVKYNYDEAVKLLKEVANTTQEVSRKELMLTLLGKVAENQVESTHFSSALNNLKARRLKKLNIEVNSLGNNGNGIMYSVKYIEKNEESKETTTDTATMQALQKDNQKMFIENENLTKEVEMLRRELDVMKAKEVDYKNVINSFYSLAMVH